MAKAACEVCDYDDLWVEWERGQRVFYDSAADVIDREGYFVGHGPAVTECPECGAALW
jgi:hypothetical protein